MADNGGERSCTWTLADKPKGIAPAAFSWWDCTRFRRYGIPLAVDGGHVCDKCGKRVVTA